MPLTGDTYRTIVGDRPWAVASEEEVRYHESICTQRTVMRCIAAVSSDGTARGYGLAVTGPFDPKLEPGHFEIQVRVERDVRGQGIGSAMYADLEGFALAHGAVALETCIGDANSNGLAWATRRGFEEKQHLFSFRLDLKGMDQAALDPREDALPEVSTATLKTTFLATKNQHDSWKRWVGSWVLGPVHAASAVLTKGPGHVLHSRSGSDGVGPAHPVRGGPERRVQGAAAPPAGDRGSAPDLLRSPQASWASVAASLASRGNSPRAD